MVVVGWLVFAFGFAALFVLPIRYLFFTREKEDEALELSMGGAIFCIIVTVVTCVVLCKKNGIDLYSDAFMMKWLPTALGSLSCLLIVGCVIKLIVTKILD